jgi:tRNA threonylcarbamoyladenosine biosynthesis protein TsaE
VTELRGEVSLPHRRATKELARCLAPCLAGGDLLVLAGELGAGKTFFARALCRALGLPARVSVTSPTFALVNEHQTNPPMAHADLYRLESAKQVRELGLDHQRDEGRFVVVEWGEPWIDVLGGDALILTLSLGPRRATLRATGPRSRGILAEFSRRG